MTYFNLTSPLHLSKRTTKQAIALLLASFINSFIIAPAFAADGIVLSAQADLYYGASRQIIKSPDSVLARNERFVSARSESGDGTPLLAKNFELLPSPSAMESMARTQQNRLVFTGDTSSVAGHLVTMTAYNSEVSQTDGNPCRTANGFNVCLHNQEDTVAANFLPMGTVIKAPELFGDREFIVRDRTHPKYGDRVDFWFKSRQDALQFGKRRAKIVVVSTPEKVRIATVK